MSSVEDICNVFFNLEEKYDLNHFKIQDCYFWQLIRMYLYYNIAGQTQTFGQAQQKNLSLSDKVKSFMPFLKNSLFHSPLRGSFTKDYIIFDHPRKTLFKGEYRDIYSYFLVDELEGSYSFEVMEAPYLNKHFSTKRDYIKYTDRIELGSYIFKKFSKIEFSESENKLISNVKNDLEDTFRIKIDLEDIIRNHILNFKYDYMKYLELFKKRQPKKIFVVVAYENKAVIAAAKTLGIETIELQHGTISDFHLGYSYPFKTRNSKEITYFPDKILTFGEYWINKDTCPIAPKNIIPIGFAYFEEKSKDFINKKPKNRQILFISQGVIGKYLSKLAYDVALKLTDYTVVYKLHPGEYETWRNYTDLVKASNLANFKIVDNTSTPLYQLFAESSYQIGAFSTAIYEGLMFNCKTFILEVPGIEYLNDLINEGYVFKFSNSSQLIENLDKFKPKDYDKNFFFKNFDRKLLRRVIDNE